MSLCQILEASRFPLKRSAQEGNSAFLSSVCVEAPGECSCLGHRAFMSLFSSRLPGRPCCLIHFTVLSANEWYASVDFHTRHWKRDGPMGVHPGVGSYIVIRRESKERNGDSLIICHDFCVCLCVCFPGECGGGAECAAIISSRRRM